MQKDNKHWSILVIEDNPGDFFLISEFLEEYISGPDIEHVTTFSEAFKRLNDTNKDFDVVLLDLSLPDKSGEDLISDVLRLSKNKPVIVLTGFTDMGFSVRSLSLGVSDYLLKDELNGAVLYKSMVYSRERLAAAKRLLESEKRYADLFRLSPVPNIVFDLDNHEILDVNEAAVETYGYTRDEFIGMDLKLLRPEDDVELFKKIISENKGDQTILLTNIVRHKKKDGTVFRVDIRGSNMVYKGRNARLTQVHDVEERILYQEALETQNERLREIAWIQSHVVRAPLARLMGLMQMYDLISESGTMTPEEYRAEVLKTSNEIDGIIRDITQKTEQIRLDERAD